MRPNFVAFTTADDLPTTANAYPRRRAGDADLMIAKFAEDGKLLFSTYLGGSGFEGMETHTLAVDSRGNAIVAGMTMSRDFPVTPATFQTKWAGRDRRAGEGFIAKLSPDGSRLLAATYLGGAGGDGIEGIALTPNDEVIVSGGSSSADFPVTPDAYQRELAGEWDFFVTKLDADLSRLLFSTYFGGSDRDEARAVAVSGSGDIIAAGHTKSRDFPVADGFDDRLDRVWGGAYLRLTPRP